MRRRITDLSDLKVGDIALSATGREWPIACYDTMDGWVRLKGTEFGDSGEFWDEPQVFTALGGTFWRDEPTAFECDAQVTQGDPGQMHFVGQNTLVLSGIGQDVPTGRVRVTMEHVK